jgi:hypothetical protein
LVANSVEDLREHAALRINLAGKPFVDHLSKSLSKYRNLPPSKSADATIVLVVDIDDGADQYTIFATHTSVCSAPGYCQPLDDEFRERFSRLLPSLSGDLMCEHGADESDR